jgi:hypothetical protein
MPSMPSISILSPRHKKELNKAKFPLVVLEGFHWLLKGYVDTSRTQDARERTGSQMETPIPKNQ